jgi:predicted acetyltransferase
VTPTDTLALRRISGAEFGTLFAFMRTTFHEHAGPVEDRDSDLAVFEPARSIGLFDNGTLVGSAGAYSRNVTVPGGPLPVACVTWVSVAAGHTRRGLLTRMMRHQLTELHDDGREPVAALWASEPGIYGRFGYGMAARHARITANTREVRPARPVSAADRRIRAGDAADPGLRTDATGVYDRLAPTLLGHCDRRGAWWDFRLYDPEHRREGATPLRLAVHDGPDGPDGYMLYAVRNEWDQHGPRCELHIRELVAGTADAHAALWTFLFEADLIGSIHWRIAPADPAVVHLVDQPRRLTVELADNLWVRLVDVDRALAGRRYATAVDVVFEVADPFCPWNAGRWRLTAGPDGASCHRTDAPADLALTSTELGAAYLGGTTLATLAAAGRVHELRRGALLATSVAFAAAQQPYCPEVF